MKRILLLSILILSSMIIMDTLFIDKNVNTNPSTDHTDNQLYIERAETILKRGILYKDVVTKTPPLINYLLLPPVILGASPLAFEIYFSIFIVLTVLSIYHFLSKIDEKKAYLSAILFLLIPTTMATPTLCRQDESIVVFFFILPLLILYSTGKEKTYSLLASIGVWIKMHPIFLIPPFLLKKKGKELMIHIVIILAVSLVIILPFLILAGNKFLWFLKFYIFGEGEKLQGISLWRLLDANGISIPSIFLIGIMGVAILIIYAKFYREGIWKCILLSLIAYFILYPKIHYEYFLMFFALSIPYMVEDKKNILLLYAIALLTGITLLIEQRYLDWKTMEVASWFFIPLAILSMLMVDIIMLHLFRHISRENFWLDKF